MAESSTSTNDHVVPLAYAIVVGFQDRMSARHKRRQAQKEAAYLEQARLRQQEQTSMPDAEPV